MPNARDNSVNPTPSILLIGDGGTEKTRFLATCPDVYIFDTDKGTDSISGLDVEYDTFKDAPDGSKAYDPAEGIYPWGTAWGEFIKKLNSLWPDGASREEIPYRTIAIDSLTTLANICMNYVLKSAGKRGNAAPEIQHWGQQLRLLETVMDQLTAWPVILVVTAHVRRDENLLIGEKEFLPMVGGQLSGRIGIYFDEVYYTKVEGTGERRRVSLITETQGMYKQAKSRRRVPTGTAVTWQAIEPYLLGAAR